MEELQATSAIRVLTGNLSLKVAEAAGDGRQRRTFQTVGMCLDPWSGRGQVTNS